MAEEKARNFVSNSPIRQKEKENRTVNEKKKAFQEFRNIRKIRNSKHSDKIDTVIS